MYTHVHVHVCLFIHVYMVYSKALRYIDNSNYHDIFENIVIYYFHLRNIGSIEISIKLKLKFTVYRNTYGIQLRTLAERQEVTKTFEEWQVKRLENVGG